MSSLILYINYNYVYTVAKNRLTAVLIINYPLFIDLITLGLVQ